MWIFQKNILFQHRHFIIEGALHSFIHVYRDEIFTERLSFLKKCPNQIDRFSSKINPTSYLRSRFQLPLPPVLDFLASLRRSSDCNTNFNLKSVEAQLWIPLPIDCFLQKMVDKTFVLLKLLWNHRLVLIFLFCMHICIYLCYLCICTSKSNNNYLVSN